MKAFRELHHRFPIKSEPLSRFSKILKLLEGYLGLTHAALLFRSEKGFESFSTTEKSEISQGTSNFHHLTMNKKPLTRGAGGKKGRSVYWPVLIDGECVACYVLELKQGESRFTEEEEVFMELLADRTADFLSEKSLWEKIED